MSRIDIQSIRRRQILDAAEHLAAQKGWAETTIADICQQADVSTGVVTRYFPSKDEIMLAALEDVLEQLHKKIQPLVPVDAPLPVKIEGFLAILSQIATARKELPLLLLHFIATSIHRKDVAEKLQRFFAEIRSQQIARLENMDEYTHHDPALFVDLLHGMALAVIFRQAFFSEHLPPAQLAHEISQMLLKYVDLPSNAEGASPSAPSDRI